MSNRHKYNFEGGDKLTSIGATFLVSYLYYRYIDCNHFNWKTVKTYSNRIKLIDNTKKYHKDWLFHIKIYMNEKKLNSNTLGLEGETVKYMAGLLLKALEGKNVLSYYEFNPNYKVDNKSIDIILKYLKNTSYQKIYYIGYADENLIIELKNKYEIFLSDYFDRTCKNALFWSEGKTEDGLYIIDGGPVELNIPEWAKDVYVAIEGTPEHDVLILDIPIGWRIYPKHVEPAKIVFLLGDADSSNFKTDYKWTYEGIWIGRKCTISS